MARGGLFAVSSGLLDSKTKKIFAVVAWASLLVIVAVVIYGVAESLLTTGTGLAVGIVLVNMEWPLPYFAKPVSYFSIASVALFYSGLRLWEDKIAKWPPTLLYFLQLFGFVVAFASAYEVLYNFMIWGAFFSVEILRGVINPNVIVGPALPTPWDLDFATKAFSALFVISGYSVYFLRRLTHDKLI